MGKARDKSSCCSASPAYIQPSVQNSDTHEHHNSKTPHELKMATHKHHLAPHRTTISIMMKQFPHSICVARLYVEWTWWEKGGAYSFRMGGLGMAFRFKRSDGAQWAQFRFSRNLCLTNGFRAGIAEYESYSCLVSCGLLHSSSIVCAAGKDVWCLRSGA